MRSLFDYFYRCAESKDPLGPSRARECVKLLLLDLAGRKAHAAQRIFPSGAPSAASATSPARWPGATPSRGPSSP